jgi:DNA-binding response OmpR family regulator
MSKMSIPPSGVENNLRVLLVEDDVRLAALIQEYLQNQSIDVSIEHRGDLACQRIVTEVPDLVVLDLMLPGLDGLSVCRTVRPDYAGPILMLTARDEDIDQVVGLEIGADDYVTKPVQPRVLLARIRALLRRVPQAQPASNVPVAARTEHSYGIFKISAAAREAWMSGEVVELTTNEFELLWLLASRPGEILTRDVILESLRGIDYDGADRSVDLRISRLRKKLGDNTSHPARIKTIRGKGYLFVKDAWEG